MEIWGLGSVVNVEGGGWGHVVDKFQNILMSSFFSGLKITFLSNRCKGMY